MAYWMAVKLPAQVPGDRARPGPGAVLDELPGAHARLADHAQPELVRRRHLPQPRARHAELLYTAGAVQLGVVYNYLPLMILPLYVALERMDPGCSRRAATSAANAFEGFRRVTAAPRAARHRRRAAAGVRAADGRLRHPGGARRRLGQHDRPAGRSAVHHRAELGARLARWPSSSCSPILGVVVIFGVLFRLIKLDRRPVRASDSASGRIGGIGMTATAEAAARGAGRRQAPEAPPAGASTRRTSCSASGACSGSSSCSSPCS